MLPRTFRLRYRLHIRPSPNKGVGLATIPRLPREMPLFKSYSNWRQGEHDDRYSSMAMFHSQQPYDPDDETEVAAGDASNDAAEVAAGGASKDASKDASKEVLKDVSKVAAEQQMVQEKRSSRKRDQGPSVYMGSILPDVRPQEEIDLDFESTGGPYVRWVLAMLPADGDKLELEHTGLPSEYRYQPIPSLLCAYYLRNPKRQGIFEQKWFSIPGFVESYALERKGWVVVYTNEDDGHYYTPGRMNGVPVYFRLNVVVPIPAYETATAAERKIVALLGEVQRELCSVEGSCLVCWCPKVGKMRGSVLIGDGNTVRACDECVSQAQKGRIPKVWEGEVNESIVDEAEGGRRKVKKSNVDEAAKCLEGGMHESYGEGYGESYGQGYGESYGQGFGESYGESYGDANDEVKSKVHDESESDYETFDNVPLDMTDHSAVDQHLKSIMDEKVRIDNAIKKLGKKKLDPKAQELLEKMKEKQGLLQEGAGAFWDQYKIELKDLQETKKARLA